jgi:hypothetical protein
MPCSDVPLIASHRSHRQVAQARRRRSGESAQSFGKLYLHHPAGRPSSPGGAGDRFRQVGVGTSCESLGPSLSLSLSLPPSPSLSLSLSLSLSPSLPLSLPPSLPRSLAPSLSAFGCLSMCVHAGCFVRACVRGVCCAMAAAPSQMHSAVGSTCVRACVLGQAQPIRLDSPRPGDVLGVQSQEREPMLSSESPPVSPRLQATHRQSTDGTERARVGFAWECQPPPDGAAGVVGGPRRGGVGGGGGPTRGGGPPPHAQLVPKAITAVPTTTRRRRRRRRVGAAASCFSRWSSRRTL